MMIISHWEKYYYQIGVNDLALWLSIQHSAVTAIEQITCKHQIRYFKFDSEVTVLSKNPILIS